MKPPKILKPLSNKNIVPFEKLTDPPSRLFRKIADQIDVTISSWKTYIDDYIRQVHPDDPNSMDRVKKDRSTAIGNVNDTLWMSNKLSFGKMLTGLGILKVKKVTIILKVETESGEEYIAEDVTTIPSVKSK